MENKLAVPCYLLRNGKIFIEFGILEKCKWTVRYEANYFSKILFRWILSYGTVWVHSKNLCYKTSIDIKSTLCYLYKYV